MITAVHGQSGLDSLEMFINNELDQKKIPGLTVCAVKGTEIKWFRSFGWANLEQEIPMKEDAVMNIGSISKTITATAVMQLWEKKQISLDSDVSDYLPFKIRNPNFQDIPITIRQLLTHTSSIIDGPAYGGSYQCGDPQVSLEHWIKNYLTGKGDYFNRKENFLSEEPGITRKYSNVGFGLLGYIVQVVSGQSFNNYCKQHIFDPLKMFQTGWYLSEIEIENHVVPYVYITKENRDFLAKDFSKLFPTEKEFLLNTNIPACLYSFPNYPDGLLRTNAADLSHFMTAMMNGGMFQGVSILNAATIDTMLSLQIEGNHEQGLCWNRSDFDSTWGHGGYDPGIRTSLYFNPELKIGVIVFQNSNEGDPFEILKKVYVSLL